MLLLAAILCAAVSCSNKDTYFLSISKKNVDAPVHGIEDVIRVESNNGWTIIKNENDTWYTVSPEESDARYTDVTVKVSNNDTGAPRNSTFLFVNGDNMKEVVVRQEYLTIDPAKVAGTWEVTVSPSMGALIGSLYTFNTDMTCTATMMGSTYNGTYTINGNLIKIVATGKEIVIAVKSIDTDKMESTVSGFDVTLRKK